MTAVQMEDFEGSRRWDGSGSANLLRAFFQSQTEFHHLSRRWVDAKTWATLFALARTHTSIVLHVGLFKIMTLSLMGKAHRADIDLFNTLRLLVVAEFDE
jgi:hypothetical protein